MPLIPKWVILSSGTAFVSLIGGWATAASLQPTNFDPVTQTISSLYADGATDRWLMTSVLVVVGACYVVTAYGIDAVRSSARVSLLVGGTASILLAAFPEPEVGTSLQHIVITGVAFSALAVWPCLAIERHPSAPWALRPVAAIAFTAVVAACTVWFLIELSTHSAAGLAERVVTGLQATWPVVVAACLRGVPQAADQPRGGVERQTADG